MSFPPLPHHPEPHSMKWTDFSAIYTQDAPYERCKDLLSTAQAWEEGLEHAAKTVRELI